MNLLSTLCEWAPKAGRLAGTVCAALLGMQLSLSGMPDRPNVVLIVCDDLNDCITGKLMHHFHREVWEEFEYRSFAGNCWSRPDSIVSRPELCSAINERKKSEV